MDKEYINFVGENIVLPALHTLGFKAMKRLFRGLFVLCFLFLQACQPQQEQRVNVYGWSDTFPPELLEAFEKETGIKVYFDTFDSNDTLESKILLGISGYDVVFPSLWPYFARQAKANLFLKLDKSRLHFLKQLDTDIMEKFREADPQVDYGIPYSWGVFAITYNKAKIKGLKDLPLNSTKLIFDPNVLQKFSHCGVAFMDEALDVLPPLMRYLKTQDLQVASQHLKALRPYIRRFNWSRSLQDLANGEICLAQTLFSSSYKLKFELAQSKSPVKLEVIIPEEGSTIWIDIMAIPKNASNIENAYKFINFVMRPENIAQISNQHYEMNTNVESLPYLKTEVRIIQNEIQKAKKRLFQTVIFDRKAIRSYNQAMEQVTYGIE